jgi:hypothetical protein
VTKIATFRRRHPIFRYQSFAYKPIGRNLEINFVFKTEPNLVFRPKIIIYGVGQEQIDSLGPALDNFIFNLGLSEIPSYWKASCSPIIQIDCGYLTQEQINFWHKLFIKGMGQFYYQNQIDFTGKDFVKIKTKGPAFAKATAGKQDLERFTDEPKYLIPLGGGKDSIVALEVLKKTGAKINTVTRSCMTAAINLSLAADFKKPILYDWFLDPLLIKLNRQGYFNGHIPITAFNSLAAVFLANLSGYNQVVFANEASSNEENLTWHGLKINHQYSKSLEFENDFRQYCQKYLTRQVNYFSLLRPFSELQITKLFTAYPKYFKIFRSCNLKGQKSNRWCNDCPKCLSVFLHLSAFLSQDKVTEIFGQNLFEKVRLLPTFKQLLGISGFKPFECVGTIRENLAASWLVLQKIKKPLPLLLQTAQHYLKSLNYSQAQAGKVINSWNAKHNVPKNLVKLLKLLK